MVAMFAIASRTSSTAPAPTLVSAPDLHRASVARLQHRAGDPRAAVTYRHAIRDAIAGGDGRLAAWRCRKLPSDQITVTCSASRCWG